MQSKACRHIDCLRSFSKWNTRWKHEAYDHKKCIRVCGKCDEHRKPKPQCVHCKASFLSESNLRRHERQHICKKPSLPIPRTDQTVGLGLYELVEAMDEMENLDSENLPVTGLDGIEEVRTDVGMVQDDGDDVEVIDDTSTNQQSSKHRKKTKRSPMTETKPDDRKPFSELCRSERWRIEKEFLAHAMHVFRVQREDQLPHILKHLCRAIEKEEDQRKKILQVARYCHESQVTRESWPSLEAIMQSGLSWNSIWKTLERITAVLTPIPIGEGVEGHRYSLNPFVSLLLEQHGFDSEKPTRLKLSIDGASKTNKSRFISITIEPLDVPDEDLYSEENAHLVGFFWGEETEANLRKGLLPFVNELLQLIQNGLQIPQNDGTFVTVSVEFFLACDMVCLAKVLGFNSVWNHNAKSTCLWCEATKEKLGDFTICEWPFRNIGEVVHVGASQATKKKPTPIKGIVVSNNIDVGWRNEV